MGFYKIFSIPSTLFKTVIRDYKFLLIAFLAPIILLLVFSVSYKPEIGQIRIGIIDYDNKNNENIGELDISLSIKKLLQENIKNVKIVDYQDFEIAEKDFNKDKIDGLILLPENLNQSVFLKLSGIPLENPSQLIFYKDESNKTKSSIIQAALENIVIEISKSFGIEPAFLIYEKSFYPEEITEEKIWTAGITGFSIFVLSLIFSISLIAIEKSNGIFDSIISSSMRSFEIVIGYFFGYLFINIIHILILLSTYLIFFKGILSILLFYIFIIMFLLSCCGSLLGIFLVGIFNSSIRSFQIAVIIILISLLISGIFWPVSNLPKTGKIISYFLPTSFGVESIKSIVLKGVNFSSFLHNFFILIGFSVLFFILNIFVIRKQID